jgi:hypothetical protein
MRSNRLTLRRLAEVVAVVAVMMWAIPEEDQSVKIRAGLGEPASVEADRLRRATARDDERSIERRCGRNVRATPKDLPADKGAQGR